MQGYVLKSANRSGFTLIELSIVLAIIGLIVGSVLAGRDMIRAAQLRSLIAETQSYITAANTFRAKYNCLPGDCDHATQLFGTASNCAGATTATGTQTCDGDGNGQINIFDATRTLYEQERVFQHLSSAGLIKGQYQLVTGGGGSGGYVGTNFPRSSINPSLAATIYWVGYNDVNNNNIYYTGDYGNVLTWGGVADESFASQQVLNVAKLSTIDMQSIDGKLDDAMPGLGTVRAIGAPNGAGLGNNCSTSGIAATSQYNNSYTSGDACIPVFVRVF